MADDWIHVLERASAGIASVGSSDYGSTAADETPATWQLACREFRENDISRGHAVDTGPAELPY